MEAQNSSHKRFQELLVSICAKETSSDPDGWTAANPLWGHCAVASLVAEDYFGGELLRVSLKEIPEFSAMGSHYFNRCEGGTLVDFTAAQFGERYPRDLKMETRTREYLLSSEKTKQRYLLLKERMERAIEDTLR